MPEAAKTAVNVEADAAREFGEQGGSGTYRVATRNALYAGNALPGTTVDGNVKMPSDAPFTTQGRVEITEPGAPTHIDYDVTSGDAGVVATLSSLTTVD